MERVTSRFIKGLLLIMIVSHVSIISAATYYISPNGSDAANGNTPGTAWKTISKVISTNLSPGDSVLFEAGGIWRDILKVKGGTNGAGNSIFYGRYGSGDNPQILGSEKASNWTASGNPKIWQASGTFDDLRPNYPAEIFFISDDSTSWGDFQAYDESFSNLSVEFDWTWNNGTIYIFSETDPNTLYDAVEIPQRDRCMVAVNTASSFIEVNGLDLFYANRSGYYSGYPEVFGATDLTFRNCTIGYIGVKGGSSAYGLVAFHSNFLVDSCFFSDCGRRAISFNLYTTRPAGEEIDIRNVIIRNSIFKRGQHTTALDLATVADCVGDTIRDVYFHNNIVDDHDIEMTGEDKTSNQIFVQVGAGYINNIYVYNNLFIAATARNILMQNGDSIYIWNNTIIGHNKNIDSSPYSNVTLSNAVTDYQNNINYDNLPENTLYNYGVLMEYETSSYINKDYNLYFMEVINSRRGFTGGFEGYYDIGEWDSYRSKYPGYDAHSPVPENPRFVDYGNYDFGLISSSPAARAGTPISMVTTDILGKPRDPQKPSIGAFEAPEPDPLNLKNVSQSDIIEVYPNPAHDEVFVKTDIESTIRVIDLTGKIVYEQHNAVNVTKINYNFKNGLYFIQLIPGNNTSSTRKLIVI